MLKRLNFAALGAAVLLALFTTAHAQTTGPSTVYVRLGDERIALPIVNYCWYPNTATPCVQSDTALPEITVPAGTDFAVEFTDPEPGLIRLQLFDDESGEQIRAYELVHHATIEPWADIANYPGTHTFSVYGLYGMRGWSVSNAIIHVETARTEPPPLVWRAGPERPEFLLGQFCWLDACVGETDPAPMPLTFAVFDRAAPLTLEFAATPPRRVTFILWDDYFDLQAGEPVATVDSLVRENRASWDVDVPPGYYVLEVVGQWDDLDSTASYFAGIIIPPPASD